MHAVISLKILKDSIWVKFNRILFTIGKHTEKKQAHRQKRVIAIPQAGFFVIVDNLTSVEFFRAYFVTILKSLISLIQSSLAENIYKDALLSGTYK